MDKYNIAFKLSDSIIAASRNDLNSLFIWTSDCSHFSERAAAFQLLYRIGGKYNQRMSVVAISDVRRLAEVFIN